MHDGATFSHLSRQEEICKVSSLLKWVPTIYLEKKENNLFELFYLGQTQPACI